MQVDYELGYGLDSEIFLEQLIENSRYLIKEKNAITPAIPIETGFYIYLYSKVYLPETFWISPGMIIRWAILYELFLIMEASNKERFQLNLKNSIHFLTEWLDDLMLFNWELNLSGDLVDWSDKELEDYPYILKYCKHCFVEIKEHLPIESLHYLRKHTDGDCSRKYNNNDLKIISKAVSSIGRDLYNIVKKIETSPEQRDTLFHELKGTLGKTREALTSIAKKWHDRLRKEWFYNKPDFNPIIEITNRNILYCPENRTKKYSELTKSIKNASPDAGNIWRIHSELSESNRTQPLSFVNLLRRYFYEEQIYFYVSKHNPRK